MPPSQGQAGPVANPENAGVERASAVEPDRVVVSPAEAEGTLLHRVEPEYPDDARAQKVEGPVVLEVQIGRDGAVEDVKLTNGPPLLARAATDAVKQWRFKPRLMNGHAVEMQTKVTLNFRLPH
jgi:protein TonB